MSFVFLEEGVCYDKYILLAKLYYQPLPCFIPHSKAKFACYSRCFLTSYFCIPVPYNEKVIFFGCQFQKALQVFIEPFNFSFFSSTGQDIDLDYFDIEQVALEMNRDHAVIFQTASKYCISDSFVDHNGYSISSKGFLPTGIPVIYPCYLVMYGCESWTVKKAERQRIDAF